MCKYCITKGVISSYIIEKERCKDLPSGDPIRRKTITARVDGNAYLAQITFRLSNYQHMIINPVNNLSNN